MVSTLMASSSAATTARPVPRSSLSPSRAIRKSIRAQIIDRFIALLKPSSAFTAAIAVILMPAMAEQMEKAALFDFNLTLPAIALEFLLLMVALDKIYFTPLGQFMYKQDEAVRAQLGDVKDTSGEVKQLEEQAEAVMKAARVEIAVALNKMKKETTTAELEQKLALGKKKVEEELAEALAALESRKEETLRALDSQIMLLGDEIVFFPLLNVFFFSLMCLSLFKSLWLVAIGIPERCN